MNNINKHYGHRRFLEIELSKQIDGSEIIDEKKNKKIKNEFQNS